MLLSLASHVSNAWPQHPWFLSDGSISELALDDSDTGLVLRQCLDKPEYFRELDSPLRRFFAEFSDGGAKLAEVRRQSLTCYVRATGPTALRVGQPQSSALAGQWRTDQDFRCDGRVLRGQLSISVPTREEIAAFGYSARPDRGVLRSQVRLTEPGSGRQVLGLLSTGSFGGSAFEAAFPARAESLQDPHALWDGSVNWLELRARPDAPARLQARLRLRVCELELTFTRQDEAPPAKAVACADEQYRRAINDTTLIPGLCRYFEANAARCGLNTGLRQNALPVGDPVALAQALMTSVDTAESHLGQAALQVANGCIQTLLRIAAFNNAGPRVQKLVEVLNGGLSAMLDDATQNAYPNQGIIEKAGELMELMSEGAKGVPGNADTMLEQILRCAQSPGNVIMRFAELQGSRRLQQIVLSSDANLRRYLDLAQATGPLVQGWALAARADRQRDEGIAQCVGPVAVPANDMYRGSAGDFRVDRAARRIVAESFFLLGAGAWNYQERNGTLVLQKTGGGDIGIVLVPLNEKCLSIGYDGMFQSCLP